MTKLIVAFGNFRNPPKKFGDSDTRNAFRGNNILRLPKQCPLVLIIKINWRKKGKLHPITCHQGTEKEQRYDCTLSLTSAPDESDATPRPLYPRERSGNHRIGGWVGPRAGLDGGGKSRPHPTGIRSPDRPARSESLYRLSYRGRQGRLQPAYVKWWEVRRVETAWSGGCGVCRSGGKWSYGLGGPILTLELWRVACMGEWRTLSKLWREGRGSVQTKQYSAELRKKIRNGEFLPHKEHNASSLQRQNDLCVEQYQFYVASNIYNTFIHHVWEMQHLLLLQQVVRMVTTDH